MTENTLLMAKLHIPPLRSDYVPRPRLVARLQEGLGRKLTVLSTPAGFGKTTLLCEWLKQTNLPAAWVSLDDGDNDHGRFITYVMAALRSLNIGLDEPIQAISQAVVDGIPLDSQMTVLLNDFATLAAETTDVILVLDDYHVIQNPIVHNSMAFALEYLPDRLHIVIASRGEPHLPLARLRARRQLNELRAADLRFTPEETELFLNQSSRLALSSAHLAALEDRTEGWIAGLQLAALALSGRSDIDTFMRDFTGSHRYILDYLVDEVFSRQPQDILDFLLKTSILERLTAGLCDAVTGQENGHVMLGRLERENLFIVPLDDQGQWYRYHHLFAGLLKNRAGQLASLELASLHRNAALWFDAHNQPYDAIQHALDARDYDLAVQMMVMATPALAMRSETSTMMKWLDALPRAMTLSNPRIPLMFAWAHFFMTDIDAVEPYICDALRILGLDADDPENWPAAVEIPSLTREMMAQVFALRTFVAVNQGDPEKGIHLGREALAHLSTGEKLGRFAVLAALGDAYRDSDNFAAASQAYSEALTISEVIDLSAHTASLTMRMDLARLRVKMGQLRYAETICREVIAWGAERYHPLFPVAQAYTLLGDILREGNKLDAAELTLSTGINQCEWAGYQRYLVYCLVSLARIKAVRGDIPAVEVSLQAASRAAATSGSEPLRAWVEQFKVRLLKKEATAWMDLHPFAVHTDIPYQREDEALTFTRLHLELARSGRSASAQLIYDSLERMLSAAQKSARTGSAIEIMLLQAQVLQGLGRSADALKKFTQCLSLAEPEGYMRLFIDEGAPIIEFLLLAIQHNIHVDYAGNLLALMQQGSPAAGNLPEPLTEREGEVLRMLATGLSNQEIAGKLVISLSTIKTHITRIYNKLDVASRTQAIVRARELKII